MARKHPQSKINLALSQLCEADRREFKDLVKSNCNYMYLREWFNERGHEITKQNLSDWWRSNQPIGKEAALINEISEAFTGIEGDQLLQMAATITATQLSQLQHHIDDDTLTATSSESKLTTLTQLLKELRQSANDLHNQKFISDRRALILTGASIMAEELQRIFTDSPFAEALNTGVYAAMSKLDETT